MRKIICELCGTVYADTEEKCPTCGTEKPASVEYIPESPAESGTRREYTPTKGGRFSNSNVKKRLQGKGVAPTPAPRKKPAQPQQQPRQQQAPRKEQTKPQPKQESSGSNKGLVIAAILLVIAIIGMLIYIYVTFLMPPAEKPEDTKNTNPPVNTQQTTTEPEDLSCKAIVLSASEVTLEEAGASWLLNVITEPVNTTDSLTFVSADPSVAEVSADGKITAVAAGETVITVTCGSLEATCKVICNIVPETTVPETTVPETTEKVIELKLNRSDITFSSKGEAWPLYKGEIPLTDIVWSVGNENVATIKNGTVRAVGPGTTTVYAEYNGQKVSCIIRCNFG